MKSGLDAMPLFLLDDLLSTPSLSFLFVNGLITLIITPCSYIFFSFYQARGAVAQKYI